MDSGYQDRVFWSFWQISSSSSGPPFEHLAHEEFSRLQSIAHFA
jgi:hypothetical protein